MIKEKSTDKVSLKPPLNSVCFDFSTLTDNDDYLIFSLDNGKKTKAYDALIKKLKMCCEKSYAQLCNLGKVQGAETIALHEINVKIQNVFKKHNLYSPDAKATVIRFGTDYRLICGADMAQQNLLHVIAFDVNYSAYKH